ncbi:hypothetical protein ES332_D09G234400v1 [Gossypium tomentosum]|uniref:Uncharacterized protein n=1 Tax=Gossypium tomentosum TaxID=34277 RepID=A0A5D2JLT9_GOSTO|nr:hypothetical protein ES332_D09G234400v1 [Gossypium tomentosum]
MIVWTVGLKQIEASSTRKKLKQLTAIAATIWKRESAASRAITAINFRSSRHPRSIKTIAILELMAAVVQNNLEMPLQLTGMKQPAEGVRGLRQGRENRRGKLMSKDL